MKSTVFAILLSILGLHSELLAQFKNYNTEDQFWYDGTVVLNSGEALTGTINYNFVMDLVKIKSPDGEIKTLIPSNVSHFVLSDSSNTNNFYSLPFDIYDQEKRNRTFFQEVYRNDHYMILSRHLIDIKNVDMPVGANGIAVNFNITKEKVFQVIYLANMEGLITPCLERKKVVNNTLTGIALMLGWDGSINKLPESETNYTERRLSKSNTETEIERYKLIDKDSFEDFFSEEYQSFDIFVESNDLDIRTIEGLIMGLQFQSGQ